MVSTAFGAEDPGRIQRPLVPLLRAFMKSPAPGAALSIRVASAPDLDGVTGRYFAHGKEQAPAPRGRDEAVAERLWRVSADLVGQPLRRT